MSNLLQDRIEDTSPNNFNLPGFRTALAMNVGVLAKDSNLVTLTVESTTAYAYTGDFFGLLKHLRIPDHYHYFMAYINRIEDPQMFDGLLTDILLVNNTTLDQFSSAYRTTIA